MTMYGEPVSSVPTSMTRATCSLWIETAARASRRKRSVASSRFAASGRRNLTATFCRKATWCAATTTPMPP